ncbi:MAG: class I SAM-dependent methyltransferase [Dehalococcoidales bacterium]|nr:MAG: class I SAM-dependent methyltransferase [Dehalococcoidales bacterium]
MDYLESNKDAWNKQSKRYLKEAGFSNDILDFGDPRCLTDEELYLIGDVRNKKILELGCGGANAGISLAKRGGLVTGIDISEKQIAFAKEESIREGVEIQLEVSSIEDYVFRGKYDLVISVCAFQYVDNLERVFRKIYEHLTFGGEFIFSTSHPAFYTAAYATIWKDEKEKTHYHDEKQETWKWGDSGQDDFSFTTFPHPVEFYINQLSACGYRIDRMHELTVPHEEIMNEEERLETIFPRILVVKAVKDK